MTIAQAALAALRRIGRPATVSDIYEIIMSHQMYEFGAQNPLSVLRVTIQRHCVDTGYSKTHKEKLFYREKAGVYGLLSDQRSKPRSTQSVSESAPTAYAITTPGDELRSRIEDLCIELREQTKADLLAHLRGLDPIDFERFCRMFLRAYGFIDMRVSPPSRDGGIDVYGRLPVGLSEMDVAVQCKKYAEGRSVGRPTLSQFRGDITGEYQQGILITTGSFTKEAQEYSIKSGCVPIILIDGEAITDFMIEKGIGVEKQTVDTFQLDSLLLE